MPYVQGGFVLSASLDGFDELVTRLDTGLDTIWKLRDVVTEYAYKTQAQSVLNVSGTTVTYSGGTFVVNRQTGKLAQSIQVLSGWATGGHGLAAVVYASAKYADIIESGVDHPVDMKPYLMGKTIAIKVGKNGNRFIPYPVMSGLGADGSPAGNSHQGRVTARKVPKRASTGKLVGFDYVIFRKVTAQSKGWIIPPRPARPFMQAAAEKIEPEFQRAIADAYANFLQGEGT